MKYHVRLVADFEIEAENVMQARRASKYVRSIGERSGAMRLRNNRDAVRYITTRLLEAVTIPVRIDAKEKK